MYDFGPDNDAPRSAAASITMHCSLRAEIAFREAGRCLELLPDPDSQRLSCVAFRLAQRVAIDAGRLERAA